MNYELETFLAALVVVRCVNESDQMKIFSLSYLFKITLIFIFLFKIRHIHILSLSVKITGHEMIMSANE
jgi:hypothetical protein